MATSIRKTLYLQRWAFPVCSAGSSETTLTLCRRRRRTTKSKRRRRPATICTSVRRRIVLRCLSQRASCVADLNHILHSCAHSLGLKPDGGPLLGIFHHIEQYLDWLVSVAKPQKLCLLAVDGVAPKAKLVQQRTRRFLGVYRRELEREIGNAMRCDDRSVRFVRGAVGPEVHRAMEKRAGQKFSIPPSFDQNIITPVRPLPPFAFAYLYYMWLTGDAVYGRTDQAAARVRRRSAEKQGRVEESQGRSQASAA